MQRRNDRRPHLDRAPQSSFLFIRTLPGSVALSKIQKFGPQQVVSNRERESTCRMPTPPKKINATDPERDGAVRHHSNQGRHCETEEGKDDHRARLRGVARLTSISPALSLKASYPGARAAEPAAPYRALVFSAIFSMSESKRIAHRLLDEWSTTRRALS